MVRKSDIKSNGEKALNSENKTCTSWHKNFTN